jgi:hypothetical protein
MIKSCVVCGVEFDGHHNAKLCSNECKQERKRVTWQNFYASRHPKIAEKKARLRLEKKIRGLARKCVTCDADITKLRVNRTTCSKECRRQLVNKNATARRKPVSTFKDCTICGKRFKVVSNDLTCSDVCRAARKEIVRKEMLPIYRTRDKERYWRDREKRLAAVTQHRREMITALRLLREIEEKGLEALL